MTDPMPVAVVLGSSESPPPGIEAVDATFDLRFAPDVDALRAALPDAQVVFSWRAEPGQLEAAWNEVHELRWIQSASAGVDSLLFPALIDSDVIVTNARGVFDEPIAEWVIGAMLAFSTGLHRSIVDQQRGVWDEDRSTERLDGAHLVVVGPGPIGRASAVRARALGMTVAAVGSHARRDDTFGNVAGPDGLHAALAEADFVLDALPLTARTARMFDARAFGAMRPTARFLNVGRGGTVDQNALIEALQRGAIAGAALDVFAEEPLPAESPLWSLPGVIVSPHVSGDFEGWERAVVGVFLDNAGRWVRGEPLVNLVDRSVGHSAG